MLQANNQIPFNERCPPNIRVSAYKLQPQIKDAHGHCSEIAIIPCMYLILSNQAGHVIE
jgi:hypothetical protein